MAKVTFDYGKAANVIAPHEMESMAEIAAKAKEIL